jgi:hypothetical protein
MSKKRNLNELIVDEVDESDASISLPAEGAPDAIEDQRRSRIGRGDRSDQHECSHLKIASAKPFKANNETSSESDDELVGEKHKPARRHSGKGLQVLAREKGVSSKANGGPKSSERRDDDVANGSKQQSTTRIKLSLKLPLAKSLQSKRNPTVVKKMKLPMSRSLESKAMDSPIDSSSGVDDEINEPQAMVVDSDEAGEVDAIATAVQDDLPNSIKRNATSNALKASGQSISVKKTNESSTKKGCVLVSSSKTVYSSAKRRSLHPSLQIRLPPIPSPGLLIPPATTSNQNAQKNLLSTKINGSGLSTPNELFDNFMELAGYTLEKRSQQPHRGSSVKRTVGDMFDSNVSLVLQFPDLVPPGFLGPGVKLEPKSKPAVPVQTIDPAMAANLNDPETDSDASAAVVSQLIDCMEGVSRTVRSSESLTLAGGSRKRSLCFSDMAPVSLTLPYSEEYIQKQVEYVEAVKRRENAIVRWQEEQQNIEIGAEEGESSEIGTELLHCRNLAEHVSIPPIPIPTGTSINRRTS